MTVAARPPGEALTLRELFEHAVTRYPERVAFRRKNPVGYGLWTYKDVHDYVRRFSGALLELGVKKGDRIAILADNCPEWGVAYFTIASLGAVAVPLDRMLDKAHIVDLLARSEARFAVAAAAFTPQVLEALVHAPAVEKILSMEQPHDDGTVHGYEDLLLLGERSGRTYHEVEVGPTDLLSIVFTPGTTGEPRGVMITHGNIAFEAWSLNQANPWQDDDCLLSLLPIAHLHEFMTGFIGPFVAGCQVAYINTLVPSRIVEALSESRITRIVGMPLLTALMFREVADRVEKLSGVQKFLYFRGMDLARSLRGLTGAFAGKLLFKEVHSAFGGHLRQVIVGGARMDPDMADRILDAGFPLYVDYGLTEASAVSAFGNASEIPRGSAGRAIPGVTLAIREPSVDGIGEIEISGPSVMRGYFGNMAPGGATLQGHTLRTGDLGYIDPDGYLFVAGRTSDVIHARGGRLFPDELERQYAGLKLVKELAIVGAPGPGGTEEPHAVIVPDTQHAAAPSDPTLLERAIGDELAARASELPPERAVTSASFLDALPKTTTMKVHRAELRRRAAERAGASDVHRLEAAPAATDAPARFTKPATTIREFLELCATAYGDRVAVSINRQGAWVLLTYRQLHDQSLAVARRLRTAGLKTGDRAALLSESALEWTTHYFGTILAGGVVIPMDPKLTPSELGNILRHAEPTFVIASPALLDTARSLRFVPAVPFKVWNFEETRFDSLLDEEEVPPDPRHVDDTAMISYTSGTSGAPKGVMLSARALLFEAEALQSQDPDTTTITLSILPLNHLYGLTAGLIFNLRCGTELCLAHDLSPQAIVHCLRSRKVTRLLAVPLFAKMLLRGIKKKLEQSAGIAKRGMFAAMVASMARSPIRPLQNIFFRQIHEGFGSTLKEIICGGAALDPEAASFFRAINIPVYIGYGLTETGPVVSLNSPAVHRARSVGRVVPGVEVKIERKNPEDFGGEIWIRGPNVMNGYFKNPGLTAETITEDGWFKSGDVGWLDEDGFLYVQGKTKALIVLSSGKKVHPEEVEDVLGGSTLIKDVCVIGLTARSGSGETTTAVIFPTEDVLKAEPDAKALEALMRKEVDELCRDLAPFKRPIRLIVRRTPFVMTTSMKIKREALRTELEQDAPRPSVDRRVRV